MMQTIAAYLSAFASGIGLSVFIGIVWWAWSEKRYSANEESANIPFLLLEEYQKEI
jgi:cytochrome c oxidase cbb3-type subunit 4